MPKLCNVVCVHLLYIFLCSMHFLLPFFWHVNAISKMLVYRKSEEMVSMLMRLAPVPVEDE